MRPEVEEYVKKKEAEVAAEREKKELARRNKILVNAGFCEKEYQQADGGSADYPYWDSEKSLYYKMRAIAVSDEEFREIAKYAVKEETVPGVGRKIMTYALVARWLGIISSFFAGVWLMGLSDELIFAGFLTIALGVLGSLVTSWYVYGFGQLVDDNHAIREKLEEEA